MYCAKCGKKNADDRLFCGFCGSPLDTPDAPAPEKDEERRLYGRPESAFAEREREEDVAPRPRRAARHAKPMEASAEDDAGQPADGAETAAPREARSAREEEAARRRYGRPEGKEDAEPREAFRSADEEEEDSRRRYGRPEGDVEPPIAPREARSAREEEAARRRYGRPEGKEDIEPREAFRSAGEEEEAARRRYGRPEGEDAEPREAFRSASEEEEDSRRRYGRPEGDVEPPIAPREVRSVREEEAARRRYGRPEGEDNPRSVSRSASEEEERYGRLEEEEGPREASRSEEEEDEPVDPLARPLLNKPVELRVKHPPRLSRTSAPVKPRAATGARRVYTVVPQRELDPDNLFLEDEAEDDLADFVSEYFDDYRYEEPTKQNFFLRHIRGVVCLTLLAIVTLIVGYWLLYGSGQRVLGQLYISSDPATYITLGDEANEAQNYETAGAYYLKALSLDPTDRNCAINAANAYIRAGNSGGAAEALEYLIAINPDDLAPYVTLKQLYPDAASRPQRLTQLLQQGYERTGEESLLD